MALDLMGWFEQQVIPALLEQLDTALPEYGWRRRASYWQATAKGATEPLWSARPEHVLAHHLTPWGVSINDTQRFIPWLCVPLDGVIEGPPLTQDALSARIRALAARVGLEPPADLTPLSKAELESTVRMWMLESLAEGGREVFRKGRLGRQWMQTRRGLNEEQVEALALGLFYGPSLLERLRADGFGDDLIKAFGFFEVAEQWPRRLMVPWRGKTGKLCSIAGIALGEGAPMGLWPHTEAPPLFGLDVTLRHPDGTQHLVIVEDLLDAITLHAHDLRRFVALGRSPWGVSEGLWRVLDRLGVEEVTLATYPAEATLHALGQHRASGALCAPFVLSLHSESPSPARLVESAGVEALQKALAEQRQSAARYTVEAALGEVQPSDPPEARQQALVRWFKAATPALMDADMEALIALKLAQRQTGFEATAIERLRHQCPPDEPAPLPLLAIVRGAQAEAPPHEPVHDALDAAWTQAKRTGLWLGLVSLPQTPSRTRSLLLWLMSRPMRQGLRVLWISPDVASQDQTARVALALAAVYGPPALRVRIVEPSHGLSPDITATTEEDALCFCTAATVTQHPAWATGAAQGERCVTVLEEAQHLMTGPFRQWLAVLKRPLPVRVLGVTSLPEGALDAEPHTAHDSFCGRVLYAESAAQQRATKRLNPCTTRLIATGISPDAMASDEDTAYWAQFHELSGAWISRLAAVSARDAPLLEALSGLSPCKILILTLGSGHTLRLMDQLARRGHRPAHLLPTHPDSRPLLRSPALRRFCDPAGDPEGGLLLAPFNVAPQALSEALRAADVLVVTHPSLGEARLRGLVGQLLDVGGAQPRDVQLWVLQDQWTQGFEDVAASWRAQADLVGELAQHDEPLTRIVPWDIALHLRSCVDTLGLPEDHSTLPEGWYILNINGDRRCVPVHRQHWEVWQSLWRLLLRQSGLSIDVILESFQDLPPPTPTRTALQAVVGYAAACAEVPLFAQSPSHEAFAPSAVAAEILAQNMSVLEMFKVVKARYQAHPFAPILYPKQEDYRQVIFRVLGRARLPQDPLQGASPAGWRFGETASHHNLETLMGEVLTRGAVIAGEALLGVAVRWTRQRWRGWLARVEGGDAVVVNRWLDSPDVEGHVLQFLLWTQYVRLWKPDGGALMWERLEAGWDGAGEARARLQWLARWVSAG